MEIKIPYVRYGEKIGLLRTGDVIQGLAPGSDVQAHNVKLDNFSALSGAANKLPYFTGTDSLGLTDFSVSGRTVVNCQGTTGTTTGNVMFSISPTVSTSLLTDSTSFNLLNTTATTINFAGAATTVSIGASTGTTTVNNNLTVTGNLKINGTSETFNSIVTTILDPIINIGGIADGAAPTSDDSKDRGVAFQWHDGTTAKIGFIGWDRSTQKITFIPDASISGEVVSGTAGVFDLSHTPASALSNGTSGSGSIALSTNPSFTTPNLGVFTGASGAAIVGTAAGGTVHARIVNTSGTANSKAVLALDPTGNGFGSREAQVIASTGGGNNISLHLAVSNGDVPAIQVSVNPDGTINMPGVYSAASAAAGNVVSGADGSLKRSVSTERAKKDIEPMLIENAEALLELVPIWFRSLCDGDNPEWSYYGFSAEQAAKIDPRFVFWDYPQKEVVERFWNGPVIEEKIVNGEVTQEVIKEGYYSCLTKIVADTSAPLRPEGFQYDRMVAPLLLLTKNEKEKNAKLTLRVEKLEALVENLVSKNLLTNN
jgi:hypothetical protein